MLPPWAPNTLPIPQAIVRSPAPMGGSAAPDLFSKGEIIKFFPSQSYGFVRDHLHRELFFHVDEIDLLKPKNRREYIQIGAKVGYDCTVTPNGLRVKRMKIY